MRTVWHPYHISSLSHSEFLEIFTTPCYSPGIRFVVVVIDVACTVTQLKIGSRDLKSIDNISIFN